MGGILGTQAHRHADRSDPRSRTGKEHGSPAPALAGRDAATDGGRSLTLLLSNEEIDGLLQMPDCIDAMEHAFRAFGNGRAGNAGRCEILTPTDRDDALYSLMNMNGVIPDLGVAAVRINSDILTWPASAQGVKRVKVPAAPQRALCRPGAAVQHDHRRAAGDLSGRHRPAHAHRSDLAAWRRNIWRAADARVVALLGTGWQAGSQAMAICAARPIRADSLLQPARGCAAMPLRREMSGAARHRGRPPRRRRARPCAAPTWCCARPTACSRCFRPTGSSPACM